MSGVIMVKIYLKMKCLLVIMLVSLVNVNAAPFLNQPFIHQAMMDQQMRQPIDQVMIQQPVMNPMMEQYYLDQLMQQNQFNTLQHQLMGMQQLQMQQMNAANGPMILNLPHQPIILLIPNTMTKANNNLIKSDQSEQANHKLNDNVDTIIIDAAEESNIPKFEEIEALPRRVILLPNGQRLFIGSIISAIPFLPFEVNVPDTIAWMYNGISGILGGIGQRLPFRPKPTTAESPDVMQSQEQTTPSTENRLTLIQKLTRKPIGMPILMLPVPVSQPVPVQVPIQV